MNDITILNELSKIIASRRDDSNETSYTAKLMQAGDSKICKKIGEEATEIVIAALSEDKPSLIGEIGDFIYHLNVLMVKKDVSWEDVADILHKRLNISGLEEKAARKANKK